MRSQNKKDILQSLKILLNSIKSLPNNISIEMSINLENTGIEEVPAFTFDRYKRYVNLGGQNIDIKINIPNYKDYNEEVRKALKK